MPIISAQSLKGLSVTLQLNFSLMPGKAGCYGDFKVMHSVKVSLLDFYYVMLKRGSVIQSSMYIIKLQVHCCSDRFYAIFTNKEVGANKKDLNTMGTCFEVLWAWMMYLHASL